MGTKLKVNLKGCKNPQFKLLLKSQNIVKTFFSLDFEE